MSVAFAINAGPFSAYYLGYPEEGDESSANMARSVGTRSGLLELIVTHGDNGGDQQESGESGRKTSKVGFAHLGFRVPDVAETLQRAKDRGFKVLKTVDDVRLQSMPLPSWSGHQGRKISSSQQWQGGFETTFAQIGFLEDPDGYVNLMPSLLSHSLDSTI
jgi:lactoylglutathione lyase